MSIMFITFQYYPLHSTQHIQMINQPFTLQKAEEIAEDFEDLVDTGFRNKDGEYFTISHITVCPFSEDEKSRFLEMKWTTQNIAGDREEYTGTDFDVIIIANRRGNEQRLVMDIRTYATEAGIKYRFPN